jgi:hypothetical protein
LLGSLAWLLATSRAAPCTQEETSPTGCTLTY